MDSVRPQAVLTNINGEPIFLPSLEDFAFLLQLDPAFRHDSFLKDWWRCRGEFLSTLNARMWQRLSHVASYIRSRDVIKWPPYPALHVPALLQAN